MIRLFSKLRRGFQSQGSILLRLLIYSAGCVAVLLWLISVIGNVDFFADETEYEAVLEDASGLLVNDAVKIAGVPVGKVKSIEADRGDAVVSFTVDDDIIVPGDSQSGVRWRNLLGQKYLYIYPGSDGDPLESGGRLPVEQSLASADVGDFLNAVGPVLQALDPEDANAFVESVSTALQGNEARVRSLIDDGADLSTSLGGLDGEVGSLIDNLDQVLGALADRDGALDQLVLNVASVSGDLAGRNDSLQQLVTDFAGVQRQLERLLRENRGDLDGTIDNLDRIASTLGNHREDLERALDTLPVGVVGYHTQSSFGQWFNVRASVTCVANQTQCFQENLANTGAPVQTLAGPSAGPSVADIVGFANSGGVPTP